MSSVLHIIYPISLVLRTIIFTYRKNSDSEKMDHPSLFHADDTTVGRDKRIKHLRNGNTRPFN